MFGIRLVMIITIASFVGAAALECFIHLSALDHGDEELSTPLEDLRVGVRFLIKDQPNVFGLLLFMATLSLVLIDYSGVGFLHTIRTVFGPDITVYGIADSLVDVSGVASAFVVDLFAAKPMMHRLPGLMAMPTLVMVPQSIAFLLPADAWTKFVVLIMFAYGTVVTSCFMNPIAMPAIQLSMPEIVAGKVMSMAAVVSMCTQPPDQMVYDWAHDQMPVVIVLFITIVLFAMLTVLMVPLARQFRD